MTLTLSEEISRIATVERCGLANVPVGTLHRWAETVEALQAERDHYKLALDTLHEEVESYASALQKMFGETSYALRWSPIFATIMEYVHKAGEEAREASNETSTD